MLVDELQGGHNTIQVNISFLLEKNMYVLAVSLLTTKEQFGQERCPYFSEVRFSSPQNLTYTWHLERPEDRKTVLTFSH